MRIILDAAHGIEVPGKRSPDGKFREYKWSREIISLISGKLKEKNIDFALTVTDDYEPGLRERVRRTNNLAALAGNDAMFISFHNNAAGDGSSWMNARGFSIWTSRGQTKSDDYASIIFKEFQSTFPEIKVRSDYSDGDPDYESNFAVLMCRIPAVLLEVLFQDNKEDVEILQSDEFKEKFSDSIVTAFEKIMNPD